MKITEIMTLEPVCCEPQDSALRAACVMRDLMISEVPIVIKESGILVGLVTARDLCLHVIARGKSPDSVTLKECMPDFVVCCTPTDKAQAVHKLMHEYQLHLIPVVDSTLHILGIISLSDLADKIKDEGNRKTPYKGASEPLESIAL